MNNKKTPGDIHGNLLIDFKNTEEIFQEIEVGQSHFIIDGFSGRIHTPVTNIPKAFRRFLLGPSGTRLTELDIASSQPLFAAIAANNAGRHCPEYLAACESGNLYEGIRKSCKMKEIHTAKEGMMYYLYRDPRVGPGRVDAYMQDSFPEFHQFVYDFKGKRHDGGIQLSMVMQKAEVDLVVNRLCTRIFETNPDTFVLTIHDALLVEKQDEDWVMELFMDEFKALGVTPTIRMKPAGD